MYYVDLINRYELENELENYGLIDIAETFIERVKEEVINIASSIYEQISVDARVMIGNVQKIITARFELLENDDPPEDGLEDNSVRFVEFISLDSFKE